MAKQYFAVNQIRHGQPDGDLIVFEPGQQVTGLDKDVMVALWQAGVLTEVNPDEVPKDHRDDEIARLQAELAALKAEKEAEAPAPAPVEEVKPNGDTDPDPSA
jgi:hypothetical protein